MRKCPLCTHPIRRWQRDEWMGGHWCHRKCIDRRFRSLYRSWESGKAATERNTRDRDA